MEQFIASHRRAPRELVIDFDATDDPVHGHQHGRFFHGYYDRYCFLPLYAFCGRQLLVAYLRPSNIDAARHTWAILSRLVKRLRHAWPGVRIVLRGDSAFCRRRMLDWCERHRVGYIAGLARNAVLERKVEVACEGAERGFQATGRKCWVFTEVQYGAGAWRRPRRVIARIEHGPKGRNPRFIVTNLDGQAKALYERVYCQRGEMENRIKEQQLCRPHLKPPVVDESISGDARGPGLHPARDDAPHRTAGHGPCPSAMPNPATAASEARRGGDPKHPHRRGAAVQHLPRPSVVPTPGAPAHRRIARGERAVVEKGVPGSPPGPVSYARGHRHGSKTLSRDRLHRSEAPSEAISGQSPSRICAAKCSITSNRTKLPLRAISRLEPAASRARAGLRRRSGKRPGLRGARRTGSRDPGRLRVG